MIELSLEEQKQLSGGSFLLKVYTNPGGTVIYEEDFGDSYNDAYYTGKYYESMGYTFKIFDN